MDNCVVCKQLQIFAGGLRQLQLLDFWPHGCTVVNASHQHQQHAPAVRQGELKLRVSVEHATENKMAGGDGGVEREAQQVGEIKRRGARSTNHLQRMQENGKVQCFDAGKNPLPERGVENSVC